ncbi:MAG TPA: DUF3732 domain-containing protein [Epulopiscium sp.]|nr:DUF3732 domain-containing protein [Candidatus Epulonipiscium sp.]
MKIIELVLYSKDGKKKRCIEFNKQGVTIISGKEKTGKTALLEIVQYCLGSEDCRIPEGIIKDNVSWYGIKLQFPNDQMFIARKNPEKGKQSTNQAMYIIKQNIEVPSEAPENPETNMEDIIQILTNKIGIIENLYKPDEGHTRNDLETTIRHALFYCFQDQNDIGTKKYLFHKQSEEFIPQAMRDTLPYLLGAVRKDRLRIENELTTHKRERSKIRKKIKEAELINGNDFSKAQLLLTHAQGVGILNSNNYKLDSLEEYKVVLEEVLNWEPSQVEHPNYNEINGVILEIEELRYNKRRLEDKIFSAYNFINTSEDYYDELEIQTSRLESIGLYKKLNANKNSKLDKTVKYPIPYIEQIQESLEKVKNELEGVERERPRLLSYIDELKDMKEKIIEQIECSQSKIDALYEQEEIANKYKELNTQKGIIMGKIMLWLESIQELAPQSQLTSELKRVEKEVAKFEQLLSQENIEDKTDSILNRIGNSISQYAKELELEHSENPIRFDLKGLTVVADRRDKPVPLEKMGGAANWVGYHLAVHFALHKHFIENNCPVPRFLFLDQPSYAYFPEELKQDIEDKMLKIEDREAIRKVYDFIFNTVESLCGNMQVIITDHAMLDESRFKNNLKEIWRKGQVNEALIPKEWYQ